MKQNIEQYDGSSWTETIDLKSARRYPEGMGTYTNACLAAGPSGSPTSTLKTAITESWNGSSWTEVRFNLNSIMEVQL